MSRGGGKGNLTLHNHHQNGTFFVKIAGSDNFIVQELCESRGGRSGLSVLTSLMVSVDVKLY